MTRHAMALLAAVLISAINQAHAQGAPNMLVPSANDTSSSISTDGTDPKKWDPKLEATIAAPANHRILYEDADIRVLLVTVRPGEREKVHHHGRPSVMVVASRMNLADFDAKGNKLPVAPASAITSAPVVIRFPPESAHSIQNLDKSATFKAIRVEYKHGFPRQ